jgi:hypothetical protein
VHFCFWVCKYKVSHTLSRDICLSQSLEFWFLFVSSDTELDLGVQYQIVTITECIYLQRMKNQYG